MKEYITIKNFGPLADCEEVELKQFMVLIGESASGKSTFMKVAALMRYLYKRANIRCYLKHSGITRKRFSVRLDSLLRRMDLGGMLTAESVIRYRAEVGDASYELKIANKRLGPLPNIRKEHLLLNKVSYIAESRNMIASWAEASQNDGTRLGFYFHETYQDFLRATKGDMEVSADYLPLKVRVRHPKGKPPQYEVAHGGGEKTVRLHEASLGIQQSVPVLLTAKYLSETFSFKEAFDRYILRYVYDSDELEKFHPAAPPADMEKHVNIFIEEPELSLFPDAQCRLTKALVDTALRPADGRRITLTLATHSPYVLNYFNILLNRRADALDPGRVGLYRMYDGGMQNLLKQNEKGTWVADTYDLTETMEQIFNEFVELTEQ